MVFQITIDDTASNETFFEDLDQWAQKNCDSYLGFSVTDTNDFAGGELLGRYEFQSEEDAMLFSLKWS